MLLNKSLRLNWYYMAIAFKDSWRARTTLLTNAVIFAGICLLILLLIGLKSGLVTAALLLCTMLAIFVSPLWRANRLALWPRCVTGPATPELRNKLGRAGRQRFERDFTWEVVIERYYRPLFAGSQCRSNR